LVSAAFAAQAQDDSLAALGELLYFDTNLSEPRGMSCASCHLPEAGFADPDHELSVSRGIHPGRFARRNAPTAAYALFSPAFHFDEKEGLYVGGQFWDGRAPTLEDQAREPFVDPHEMANPDLATVVRKVRQAEYADRFDAIYGAGALADELAAFTRIVNAIAAFERTARFHPFTSKYDYYLAGQVELSQQELLGLKLFDDEAKGNCAACHPSQVGEEGSPPLFTDFTYDNLGVPKNGASPFYSQSAEYNPGGKNAIDLGLAETTERAEDRGKFKVSTLRNIALTSPYMHNGIFSSLHEVVDFYNTRDTSNKWGAAEVPENVNVEVLGDLGLSDEEVDAIVAFMETLTDGYEPADSPKLSSLKRD
jgi:cytochrome c peroxidase